MKKLIGILLIATVAITGGCASAPVIPRSAMPKTPKIGIYGPMTQATPQLDCLSRELCSDRSGQKIKVMVGTLPNTFADNIGEQRLPRSMRPMVETSLSRINCVYKVYESQDLTGIQGVSDALSGNAVVAPDNLKVIVPGWLIEPDIVLTGNLYMGQLFRDAAIEAEIFNLGLGGQAKAYDVSFQLKAINGATRAFEVPSVSLTARIYEAENGGSAFYLDTSSGDLSRGRATFKQAASLSGALQLLSDRATAAVIRNVSTREFGRSFSACDNEIIGLDPTQFPDQASSNAGKKLPLTVQVYRKNNTVCMAAAIKSSGLDLHGQTLRLVWTPYSSQETLQTPGEMLGGSVPAYVINNRGEVCLPPEEVLPYTQSYEVRIENGQETLGIGLL